MAEQNEILASWDHYSEGLTQDVATFYVAVEDAVKKHSLGEVKFARVQFKEAGFFSANREYLRIGRGDLHFDICGAPFGTGFFVSARLFAEGKFADSLVGELRRGGAFSQLAAAAGAKIAGVDTYYKLDTASMFRHVVHKALTDTINEIHQTANLPALSEQDSRPVLKGFFR